MRKTLIVIKILVFIPYFISCNNTTENQEQPKEHSPLYLKARDKAKVCFNNKEECQEAIALFDTVLMADSAHHLAYYNRGVCKMTIKNFRGALDDFTQAIKINSNDADYHYNKGYVELELGLVNEACIDFKISLSKGASDAKLIIDQVCK